MSVEGGIWADDFEGIYPQFVYENPDINKSGTPFGFVDKNWSRLRQFVANRLWSQDLAREIGFRKEEVVNEARGLGDPNEFFYGGPRQYIASETMSKLENLATKFQVALQRRNKTIKAIAGTSDPEKLNRLNEIASKQFQRMREATKDSSRIAMDLLSLSPGQTIGKGNELIDPGIVPRVYSDFKKAAVSDVTNFVKHELRARELLLEMKKSG